MHEIRRFFYLDNIYHKQTLAGIGFNSLFFLLVLFIGSLFSHEIDEQYQRLLQISLYIYLTIGFYLLVRAVLRNYIVGQRIDSSSAKASSSKNVKNSTDFELDNVDQKQTLYEEKGLVIYDSIFNFYRKTKYGTELTRQAYYTVAEVGLRRTLPNIIFDSRTAKKRQFKNLFLKVQRISLEGDFDKYFDTYTPQSYHVDSLSFISPEVMEKLVECKDYDIEILGDKLLVFGPLLDEEGIEIMYEKAKSLAAAIDDNIDTYKDNRLSGKGRHTDITAFGRKLLQNPAKYYPGIFLFTGLSMLMIYLGFYVDQEFFFTEISLAIYISLAGLVYKAAKIDVHNHKMMREYLKK